MYKIQNVFAREVLDSRWNPTIETELEMINEKWEIGKWRAIVPSGASTGVHEALELRDNDKFRYLWKGVLNAVWNVNWIIKNAIVGKQFETVRDLDQLMIKLDWTSTKSKFWANAILAVSMAFVAAVAKANDQWIYEYVNKGQWYILPKPMMNIMNWWSHADNNVDIQEFMIVPVGAENVHEAIRMWSEVFHILKKILKSMWLVVSVGDEWWYAPNLKSNEEALQVIVQAINEAGYEGKVKLAMDCAASEFYKDSKYHIDGKSLSAKELIVYYEDLVSKYPIISIEDGMAEDDFDWRKEITKKLWKKIMLIGDDLFVTNMERLKMWIEQWMANSILIKLNQIWSVSETVDCVRMAQENGMSVIMSHRSWDTEDTFIADFAVALNTGFIKTWSLSRSERIAKYNQLMRIEERLWKKAKYWI